MLQTVVEALLGFDHHVGHCGVLHVTAESVYASCLRCLGLPQRVLGGPPSWPKPPITSPKATLTLWAQRSCVYELLRAFGQFTRNWADTLIQNRQPRLCGGGLEHVPLQCTSPV